MNWIPKALLVAITAACVVRGARADTFVVEQGGTGDFTTIQAAIDAVEWRADTDTVVVRPGHYAEHLSFPFLQVYPVPRQTSVLLCPGGPDSTTALDASLARRQGFYNASWQVDGLSLLEPCNMCVDDYRIPVTWTRCTFFSGYQGGGNCTDSDLQDCDFYGPVRLIGYRTTTNFRQLRFHHAPLVTAKLCGDLWYEDCTFEGLPGDTLVQVLWQEDMRFVHCTFEGGAVGVYGAVDGLWECLFRCLDTGIIGQRTSEIGVIPGYSRNRFEQCGRAFDWQAGAARFVLDSLVECGDRAVRVNPLVTIDRLSVERNAGVAVDMSEPVGNREWCGIASITRSSFRHVDGTAVRLRQRDGSPGSVAARVIGNRFEDCGAGADLLVCAAEVDSNVVFANRGTGLAVRLEGAMLPGLSPPNSVDFNTVAFNLGDGVALTGGNDSSAVLPVTRNIFAQNAGAGIAVGEGVEISFAGNDAWQNYSDYVGVTPGTINLVADPRFCDLAAGDLTVSAGSPCSAYTSTGPIGALGTGCDIELLGAPPPAAAAVAFSARPIPARGRVEFALPALAGAGRLEVLDAQGRRVWSAPLERGATSVRWQGERDAGGAAEPGVYWARLTGAGVPRTTRFVWLR